MMNKWLGLSGPEKRKSDESPDKPVKKWKAKYGENRKNKPPSINLIEKWRKLYDWLHIIGNLEDDSLPLAYCQLCRTAGKNNTFSKDFTLTSDVDPIQKHEASAGHQLAVKAVKERITAEKAREESWKKAEKTILPAFKVVYWQAKEDIALCKFSSLLSLCESVGADCVQGLKSDSGNYIYTHHSSVSDILNCLSESIFTPILIKAKSSEWYSLMIDEATDCSVCQCLSIYIKYITEDGEIKVSFLKLLELKDGATAASIFNLLDTFISSVGLNYDNLACLCTDGASVMRGCRQGVGTQIKEKSKCIITIHCCAHRLALASSDAANKIPYLVKYQETLNNLYKQFHYSPKKKRGLQDIFDLLEKTGLKFKQIFFTRWLSFFGAVEAILNNMDAVIIFLLEEDKNNPLLKVIGTYKFLAASFFLSDVLYILSRLCLKFQEQSLNITSYVEALDQCLIQLMALNHEIGINESHLVEVLSSAEQLSEGTFVYKDHSFTYSQKQEEEFKNIRKTFLKNLLDELGNRFNDQSVLRDLMILDPKFIPVLVVPEIDDDNIEVTPINYGKEQIERLASFLKLPIRQTLQEWRELKFFLTTTKSGREIKSIEQFGLYCKKNEGYQNIKTIIFYSLVLPLSTADCERCFSAMKNIKSDKRNALSVEHVDSLLRVKVEGASVKDFMYGPAMKVWFSKKSRHLV